MNPKLPSFSAYDFLGYLFPGFVALFLFDLSYAYHAYGFKIEYQSLIDRYSDVPVSGVFVLTIVAYFIGHIISFASSIVVEKYALWMYGHPKNYLLDIDCDSYFSTGKSESPATSFILRYIILILMFPVLLIDYPIGRILGLRKNYIKPMDPLIQNAAGRAIINSIKKCGIEDPGSLGKPVDHEFDKLALHYVLEEAPTHASSLKNYVVLYGFLRSACFLSLILFWGLYAHLLFSPISLILKYVILFAGSLFCISCYLNYYKFYRRYFEETFLAIITLNAKENKS